MAKQSRSNSAFSSFSGDSIERDADAARGAAIGTVMEVVGLLNVLPDAVVASQQRELERLKATKGEDNPRVAQLEASLDRAAVLRETAARGNARIQRMAVAFADDEDVFHGFVSDSNLNPLANLTVRTTNQLSATTNDDGYFRISLGTNVGGLRGITKLVRARVTKAEATASTDGVEVHVEVSQKGTVLYTDPAPLPIDQGRVYREYIVATDEGSATRDLKRKR